jgi:arylsulfatase A
VGTKKGDLIDFTDFLKTLADIAGIPAPTNYGILDGKSFYAQLTGATGTRRTSVFCHFKPNLCAQDTLIRYAQDSVYKLYETGKFYKFTTDLNEKKPLSNSSLTRKEKQIKQNFQNVLNAMHN